MPRNVSGGSGHRAQRNSEGSKARNNRCLVDALLDDLRNGESTKGVYVGRVLKRMGSGRMQVFYTGPNGGVEQIMPMRGGLRGKGKKSVWVDIDSIVMICETGLAGTTHEIVAVFTESQIAGYKKFVPDANPKLFFKTTATTSDSKDDDLFEASGEEDDDEVDVDGI
jgi:hypothetical protein